MPSVRISALKCTDYDLGLLVTSSAVLGNPFFLVKARLQAYSPQLDPTQARHRYTSTLNGLSTIIKSEGARGLTRGWDAAVLRTAMGSTVQLPAYNLAKSYLSNLKESDTFAYNPLLMLAGKPNSFLTYLASSIFSGLCVCAVMQPADTALTRMYNQPVKVLPNGRTVGALYRGPLHCLYLTAKAEGPLAWYKVREPNRESLFCECLPDRVSPFTFPPFHTLSPLHRARLPTWPVLRRTLFSRWS